MLIRYDDFPQRAPEPCFNNDHDRDTCEKQHTDGITKTLETAVNYATDMNLMHSIYSVTTCLEVALQEMNAYRLAQLAHCPLVREEQ